MAAPYCTLTGTIPGGEKGRAIIRIIPDVVGATATVNGVTVGMREQLFGQIRLVLSMLRCWLRVLE